MLIKQTSNQLHPYISGQTEVAKLLIKSDADIGAPDKDGWTPYCKAKQRGNLNNIEEQYAIENLNF